MNRCRQLKNSFLEMGKISHYAPGGIFKMILRPVASFSQSMSPFRATATHFMPKTKKIKILKTSQITKTLIT